MAVAQEVVLGQGGVTRRFTLHHAVNKRKLTERSVAERLIVLVKKLHFEGLTVDRLVRNHGNGVSFPRRVYHRDTLLRFQFLNRGTF